KGTGRSAVARRSVGPHRGNDNQRLSDRRLVGKRHVNPRRHARRRHRPKPRKRAAGQHQRRPAAGQIDDAEIAPVDAPTKAGAESLRASLFSRIALGVTLDAIGAPIGARPLLRGEDAVEKPLTKARDGLLDATDVDEVSADAEDHVLSPPRPASMAARIRAIASASPMKIASPTRKCPILSSTMVGIAAIGPTVS